MAATLRRFFDSDLWWSFTRSPITMVSAVVALICILGALFVTINLIVDLLYYAVDPRLRIGRGQGAH